MSPFYCLLNLACVTALVANASGATRAWKSPVDGEFLDPLNWATGDAPNTAAESALFDRIGVYDVRLEGGAITALDSLSISRGNMSLSGIGASAAVLDLSGSFTVDTDQFPSSTGAVLTLGVNGVAIDAGEAALIDGPTDVTINPGASLTAVQTDVGGGAGSTRSRLILNGSAPSHLGEVRVGVVGDGDHRGLLSLVNDATASFDGLSISPSGSSARGAVEVFGGALNQTPGSVTVVGAPAGQAGDTALLVASEGGVYAGATTRVLASGQLLNAGGEVVVGEAFSVEGGLYRELGAATRSFAPGAAISVSGGGELRFGGAPVEIAAGRTLWVDDGVLQAPGGLLLSGGATTVMSGGATFDAATTLSPAAALLVNENATSVFQQAFSNQGGSLSVEAGGEIRFLDAYEGGDISGAGRVVFEAMVDPGQSPGQTQLGLETVLDEGATLRIEIGGVGAGEYDSLQASGSLMLDGTLRIDLIAPDGSEPVFQPKAGDSFPLLLGETILGGFDTFELPTLSGGLEWRRVSRGGRRELLVVSPSVPGDFNHDGVVDAADYTVWRDTAGATGPMLIADADNDLDTDADDYQLWASAYNATAAQNPVAVPEPLSLLGLLACLVARQIGGARACRWG